MTVCTCVGSRVALVSCVLMLGAAAEPGVAQQGAREPARTLLFAGTADNPVLLTRVAALAVGRDGTLLVGQPQSYEIHAFDARGVLARTIGRRGSGPGEFQSISRFGSLADTLWVFDAAQRRFTMFTLEGVPINTIRFNPAPYRVAVRPLGVLAGGQVLELGALNSMELARGERREVPLMLTDRAGRTHRQIATVTVDRFAALIPMPGGRHRVVWPSLVTEAFGDDPLVRVASNGRGFLIVRRPVASGSTRSSFEVTKYTDEGSVQWTRSIAYDPTAVRKVHADSLLRMLIDWQVSAHEVPSRGIVEEAIRDAIMIPRYYPPVSGAVLGHDGSIWLREPWTGQSAVTWTVLDSLGSPVDQVVLPRTVTLMDASLRMAWGVRLDADDVPIILRYSLRQ